MQPTAQAVGSKSQIRASHEGATEMQAHEGEATMNPKSFIAVMVLLLVAGFVMIDHYPARAGEITSGYRVLEPIRHGNLTVFPVVAAKSYPTGEFLTLDEGLHSGEVIVTEAGSVQGLIRRHGAPVVRHDGAEVNRLVLVNNSKRPLLLLAGEIRQRRPPRSRDRQRPHRPPGKRSGRSRRILR
jgi:ARG and Rhodanese-Phosphatase-superfamily-associated Protein domain